jgi:tRNA-dihydrouridine synthase B
MLEETNCDAVMIGRGVLGNPWLIKECVEYLEHGTIPKPPTNEEKIMMMKRHYELLLQDKPEKVANLEIRAFILYYLKGMPKNKEIKNKICSSKSSEEMFKIIEEYYNYLQKKED